MNVAIKTLPVEWFSRPQYAPKIGHDTRRQWFVLDAAFRPTAKISTASPKDPEAGRGAVRAAFEATIQQWSLPEEAATSTALDLLDGNETAIVVTGQQPGFLGGPLLTLYKALSTVALARRYRTETGRPCVPVFWVASDDHDFEEVRTARWPQANGEVEWSFPGKPDRRPLAEYSTGRAAEQILDQACAHLDGQRHGDVASELVQLYRGRHLASGFAAMLARLLGAFGLLVIDPVVLRPLARSLFSRVIDSSGEVMEAIREGRSDVRKHGLKPRVAERFPLFLTVDGQRHHLTPEDGRFVIDGRNERISREQLLEHAEAANPPLSPGALLRPLVQQFALPAVLTIGGPAEVAYFRQLAPLAECLGVVTPDIALRFQGTLLDGKSAARVDELDWDRLASALEPADLVGPATPPAALEEARRQVETLKNALGNSLGTLPKTAPGLDRWRRRSERIADDARNLIERVERTWRSGHETELARAEALWNAVFPGGSLQERRWNMLYFIARHGTEWIGELLTYIETDPLALAHRFVVFGGRT